MLTVLCCGRHLIMKIKNHQILIMLKTSGRGVKTLAPVENCFTQTLRISLLLLFCIIFVWKYSIRANLCTRGVDFYNPVHFPQRNFSKAYSRHGGHGSEIQLNQ